MLSGPQLPGTPVPEEPLSSGLWRNLHSYTHSHICTHTHFKIKYTHMFVYTLRKPCTSKVTHPFRSRLPVESHPFQVTSSSHYTWRSSWPKGRNNCRKCPQSSGEQEPWVGVHGPEEKLHSLIWWLWKPNQEWAVTHHFIKTGRDPVKHILCFS